MNVGNGWVKQAPQDLSGSLFAVYTKGQATLKIQSLISGATVINRQVFYHHSTSTVFGDGTGNPTGAIDFSKSPLLPGQTIGFANYTNYSKGLNGIVIDVSDQIGTPTATDFQFSTWDGVTSAGFFLTAAAPSITVIPGGGAAGSQRVKIEFADNLIRNTWLRVTMLANSSTNLTANAVFYFGNAVGDVNEGNSGSPVTVQTNEADAKAIRRKLSTGIDSAAVTNVYDLNKDGRVNAIDISLAIQNQTSRSICYFTATVSLRSTLTPTLLSAPASGLTVFRFASGVPGTGIVLN